MKIAMVSEHASPLAATGGTDAGGQNVHVEALARVLGERGHAVTVYTRRADGELPDTVPFAPGAAVRHVPAGPPRYVPRDELLPYMDEFGDWLAEEFRATPPDVVHAHFWTSGLAALRAAEAVDVPVVQAFHALGHVKRRYQGEKDTSPAERPDAERRIGRAAAAVIATSSEEVDELRSMGVRRDRVAVIPCGVDLDTFTPEGEMAPRTERPRILVVGRIVERKGVDTVIRALALVPQAELVVVGGPDADGLDTDPDIRRLRDTARECGVGGRVRFHGRADHDQVPALMRSADVVVSMPWYEPFGIVPVEAMACGVPVIASAVGGHLDTVIHEVTGVLLAPRSPRVLAVRLRELLGDPVKREGYAISAADRAVACYSWERVAERTEALYETVAGGRRERGKGAVTRTRKAAETARHPS